MKAPLTIGLDLGFGQVKASCSDSREVRFPSAIYKVTDPKQSGVNARTPGLVEDGDSLWIVGEEALAASSKAEVPRVDSSWIKSPTYRVLAFHAMNRLGARNARVVLGLPVADFNKDSVNALKSVVGDWKSRAYNLEVADVVPQPVGTLLDVAYDSSGTMRRDFANARVGIIDIGSGTIDSIDTAGLRPRMGPESRRSHASGIHRAHEVLRAALEKRYNYTPGDAFLPKILETRRALISGKDTDVGRQVDDALTVVADVAARHFKELWGQGTDLSCLIATGGGAVLLHKQLRAAIPKHVTIVVPDDPGLANARGYLKYAILKR